MFFSGKIAGYIVWGLFFLIAAGIIRTREERHFLLKISTYGLGVVALIIITISLINLGKSTRFGLPTTYTKFKNMGLYKYSRNPMYVGFFLLTMASVIYIMNIFVFILGLYSIIVYHYIILSEEKFLEERFGDDYRLYKKLTKRYL